MRVTRSAALVALTVLAGALVIATCRDDAERGSPTEPGGLPLASLAPPGSVTFVGAGDISLCTHHNDTSTAKLLDTIAGTVFVTGDNVGAPGDSATYANCYNPTWGRQKARTYPVPGDVEYTTAGAPGYFGYFGAAAGDRTKGYYSYNLGAWHIVALNSATSMSAGSAQEQWLKSDLAANPSQCTLAYWHLPAFYSGTSTVRSSVLPLWNDLYAAHADVVLNSHTRNYERFAPQTPAAVLDTLQGIREFIVGTGGLGTWSFGTIAPNSLVRAQVYGVLRFTLSPGSYFWKFVPIAGTQFADSGSAVCHGSAAPIPGVNAGPDQTAHPGDTVKASVAIADVSSVGPWSYTLTWGDGSSTSGSVTASPILASHVYSALGLDSVRVTVTNRLGGSGADTVAYQIIPATTSVVFVGAGDIADCTNIGDSLTANLLDAIPGTVFAAGDNAYPSGTSTDYANCYQPTWGRHKARTHPIPGNHEYVYAGAPGYFGYYGAAAGDPTKGYYSYDLGDWHIVALNSNIAIAAGSPEEQWLRADLAASNKRCTLAYMHHPRFSSGPQGSMTMTQPLWQALYDAGAEVVVAGHDHDYERFAPQTPSGVADPVYGIREFVVGTGGSGLFTIGPILPNSEVHNDNTRGVIKFTLSTGGYTWQFIPIAGKTFTDSGSGSCHDAPSGVTNSPPQANAGGPYTGNEGAAVSFNGSGSSDPQGSTLSYAWSFGDGATGTGVNPTHVYADNGNYTVSLTVTDTLGLTSSASTTTATIANVAPTVTLPASPTATAGIADTLTVSFSDPGANDSTWTYSIDWGDGTSLATGGTKTQTAISVVHTYAAGGTDTVRVTVTDKDGGVGSAKVALVVASVNHPPTAVAGGPYTGTEGAAVSFNGSGSSDPDADAMTYAWTFGDGGSGTGVSPTHTYVDNGSYTVTLTVTDSHGAASSPSTTTATIANAPPVVTLPANQAATAGSAYSLSATFSDAGVNDAPWTYTIDWGDGTAQTTGSAASQATAISASHTYAAGGTDTVRVTVTDKDGGAGSAKTPVAVASVNHPPSAVAGGPYAGAEGAAVLFDGSGSSDPDGDALTYAWTFGDGASGTGVKPTHTYADNGSYTVTLTVTDSKGAASAPVTTTATIANAPPVVTLPANQAATAGSAYSLSATFSDAGVNDAPWTYTIDWGDGTAQTTGSAAGQATPITASHTYGAGGTDTVRVTVTDKDGGAGSAKTAVAVAAVNHAPTAVAGGPYNGTEGATVLFDGSGSSDPDGDALTYAWTFGDGASGTGVKPTHTYADNGSYTVTLVVTDSHGAASTPSTGTATITNVAPTVGAPATLAATAATPVTLSASFSDPGANDAPWAYAINWGDGSAATTGSTSSPATGISASHTYAAAGTATATVTVTDKDGGAGSATTSVTIAAPVSSVTLVGAGNIARCTNTNSQATAAIVSAIAGTVFNLGDNAYPYGTAANYQNCYGPTWGQFLTRTYPVAGNHEYDSSATAAPYFNYFGAAAGSPPQGYYSYDLGAWHIVVLNSNNAQVSTAVGSPQETWLKADLAATTKQCVLAMFHHPRFYSTTSTSFSPTTSVKPFWDDLYAAGAELIINAHMQDYERFAPQTSAGVADPVNGIREIIVGTGGSGLDSPNTLIIPNSEARISGVYGVLKLTLGAGSYSWQFVPVGSGPGDSGSGTCH